MPSPRLVIGLPVYNGQEFIAETLESIVGQTYSDLRVVVRDDGSTDSTVAICEEYAARDGRVTVSRNESNLGPARNFNRVFNDSGAELFKWCAQDDVLRPSFVEECVRALDAEPGAVLAYARAVTRSTSGNLSPPWAEDTRLSNESPRVRWNASLEPPMTPMPLALFGVIRSVALRRTRLLEGFPDCDRFLVSHLSLLGSFALVEDSLLVHSEHSGRIGLRLASDSYAAPMLWLGEEGSRVRFPHWWLARSYASVALRSSSAWSNRVACMAGVLRWAGQNQDRLGYDLIVNAEGVPLVGSALQRVRESAGSAAWDRRTRRAALVLRNHVPTGSRFVLADGNMVDRSAFASLLVVPFTDEHDDSTDAPVDSTAAVQVLRTSAAGGVRFFVLCWPAFWWLDYYSELRSFLETDARLIAADPNVMVYDLRPEVPPS